MTSLREISRLGFGVTGPHASRIAEPENVRLLISQAIAAGITYFDTGPAYGNGRGETRLGEALRRLPRDQVFISTKAGVHPGGLRDFSPDAIDASLKASLARLATPFIDLVLLHGPAAEELTPALFETLRSYQTQGLVKHIGLCGRGSELALAVEIDEIEVVMAPLNPSLDQDAMDRLTRCKQTGRKIIGIEALKGTASASRLPISRASAWYFARSVKQVMTGTGTGLERTQRTPSEALAWALDHPLSDCVVSLTSSSAHLRSNAQQAGLRPLAE